MNYQVDPEIDGGLSSLSGADADGHGVQDEPSMVSSKTRGAGAGAAGAKNETAAKEQERVGVNDLNELVQELRDETGDQSNDGAARQRGGKVAHVKQEPHTIERQEGLPRTESDGGLDSLMQEFDDAEAGK